MRGKLDRRIRKIDKLLMRMGQEAELSIEDAMAALQSPDEKLAVRVIENDRTIDQLEMDIEKACIQLIALEQPLARDLRQVSASLRIIADLERIGDYSVDIAKIQLNHRAPMSRTPLLMPMMKEVRNMLTRSINSFLEGDAEEAREVARTDEKIDQMYEEFYWKMIEELKQGVAEKEIVDLLFCGRYLERMADHITNICERIIYMIEGVREYY